MKKKEILKELREIKKILVDLDMLAKSLALGTELLKSSAIEADREIQEVKTTIEETVTNWDNEEKWEVEENGEDKDEPRYYG